MTSPGISGWLGVASSAVFVACFLAERVLVFMRWLGNQRPSPNRIAEIFSDADGLTYRQHQLQRIIVRVRIGAFLALALMMAFLFLATQTGARR